MDYVRVWKPVGRRLFGDSCSTLLQLRPLVQPNLRDRVDVDTDEVSNENAGPLVALGVRLSLQRGQRFLTLPHAKRPFAPLRCNIQPHLCF